MDQEQDQSPQRTATIDGIGSNQKRKKQTERDLKVKKKRKIEDSEEVSADHNPVSKGCPAVATMYQDLGIQNHTIGGQAGSNKDNTNTLSKPLQDSTKNKLLQKIYESNLQNAEDKVKSGVAPSGGMRGMMGPIMGGAGGMPGSREGQHIQESFLFPAIEITSTGCAGDYQGDMMGRFEILSGEERNGYPVYQQAHSREMPENDEVLLFRWEN